MSLLVAHVLMRCEGRNPDIWLPRVFSQAQAVWTNKERRIKTTGIKMYSAYPTADTKVNWIC
jgi:hypothetical protein